MEILIAKVADMISSINIVSVLESIIKVGHYSKQTLKRCDAIYVIDNKPCRCLSITEKCDFVDFFSNTHQLNFHYTFCNNCRHIIYPHDRKVATGEFIKLYSKISLLPTTYDDEGVISLLKLVQECSCGKVYLEHFDFVRTDFVKMRLDSFVLE